MNLFYLWECVLDGFFLYLATASATGAVWSAKHGYYYWAAYFVVVALDFLSTHHHNKRANYDA